MRIPIQSGSSVSIALLSGSVVRLSGFGSYQLAANTGAYPAAASAGLIVLSNAALVGPFDADVVVVVNAVSAVVADITTGKSLVSPQNIMTRSLTGRSNAVAASSTIFTGAPLVTGLTQHQRVALACPFDAIRIGIPNMHTASVANVLAAVGVTNALGAWSASPPTLNNTGAATAASPTPSETVSAAGAWRNFTFNGAASATLPAAVDATNLVPSITWSDWAPVSSVPRTDGGVFPLVDIRLFIPAAAGSITVGWTGASNSAWAVAGRDDLYTGGRAYRSWNQDTDAVTTPANFTATTTTPTVIPIYIQYRSRQPALTVLSLGDSIYEGTAGSTYPANNFVFKSVVALHSQSVPLEYCSANAAGATSLQLARKIGVVLDDIPNVLLAFEPASVNNFGASLGSRVQQEGLGSVGVIQSLLTSKQAGLILCSMLPVTNAARAWGATDSQRQQLNNSLEWACQRSNALFCDFSPVYNGPVVSSQIEPQASLISGDGVHPNDAGQTALSVAFSTTLRQALAAIA